MLVDELLDALVTMPPTACVIMLDADNPDAEYRPGELRYQNATVEIRLDFDRWRPGADDDIDDDEDEAGDFVDVPVNTRKWQRVRRAAAHVFNGIDEGYPLA